MLIETLGTARDLGRLNEIAGVLIRHGFGDTVRRLGLADTLARAGHVLHWDHAGDLARLEPPVQVRRALEELGPTFVKLGQILAGRADLFGPDWIAEFAKLHSRVPPLPLDALRPQLREDLGGEPEAVFARFDVEPLAAASIAQVHRAQLKDGTEVVVKIRRPDIRDVIEADLRLLDRAGRGGRPGLAGAQALPAAPAGARVRALAAPRARPRRRMPQCRAHRGQPGRAARGGDPARALGLHRRARQRAGLHRRHSRRRPRAHRRAKGSTASCWPSAARARC